MEYVYEYDIWGGVKSCTPKEEKVEAPKKKGSKKKGIVVEDNEQENP